MADLLTALCDRLGTSLDRQGRAHAVCPFCGAPVGYHFYVYSLRNRQGAVCWSCGYRGSLAKLAAALDVQGSERASETPQAPAPIPTPPWAADDALSRYRRGMQARWIDVVAAWQSYKPLSEESIRSADLGLGKLPLYDEQRDRWYESRYPRLLYPLVEGGRIVGIAGRAYLPEDTGPKWLTGSCSTLILHGLDTIGPGDTVAWVENRVDRLLITEHTLSDEKCIASGGLTWRPEWLDAIAARKPACVIINFDNDLSGCPSPQMYIKGRKDWHARMEERVRTGKIPGMPSFQEPRGPIIANELLRRGVRTVVANDWGNAPEHQDPGSLIAAEMRLTAA